MIQIEPCGNKGMQDILEDIAEALEEARHGYDYGEMTPENAFHAATSAVAAAIRKALA